MDADTTEFRSNCHSQIRMSFMNRTVTRILERHSQTWISPDENTFKTYMGLFSLLLRNTYLSQVLKMIESYAWQDAGWSSAGSHRIENFLDHNTNSSCFFLQLIQTFIHVNVKEFWYFNADLGTSFGRLLCALTLLVLKIGT